MKRFAAYLIALAALVCAGPAAAQSEAGEDDASFLERLIQDSLSAPGQTVRVRGFDGVLSSEAQLGVLTIADEQGIWLTLRNAQLVWTRTALLRGRLEVDSLSAEELIIERQPIPADADGPELPSAAATGFRLPDLPVSVRIDEFAIARAEIGEPILGQAVEATLSGTARLADGDGAVQLALERTDGRAGSLSLEGAFSNATRELTLDLGLSEAEGGIAATMLGLPGEPSLDLDIAGSGPLSDFAADIRLATAGTERLTGQVALIETDDAASAFRADIAGDIRPLLAQEYRDFFGGEVALVLRGQRDAAGATVIERLALSAAELDLEGSAEIAPDGLPRRFDLDGRVASTDGSPVLLPIPGEPTEIGSAALTLGFDETAGEAWEARIVVEGLDRPDFKAARLVLDGSGEIGRSVEGNRVAASFDFSAAGLGTPDPAINQALGDRLDGRAEIRWQTDDPVRIDLLQVSGEGLSVTAAGEIDGLDSALAVAGEAAVSAVDISRFSALAGRSLSGGADVTLTGAGSVLDGTLDLSLAGEGRNLRFGIAQLDPLLAGVTDAALTLRRDATGTYLDALRLKSERADIEAQAALGNAERSLALDAALTDLADVLPDVDGPANLTLRASDPELRDVWDISLEATGPGGALLSADGTLSDPLGEGRFDGTLAAEIARLSAYAGAAGLPLGGSVEADVEGRVAVSTLEFDVTASTTTRNLTTGIKQADTLLRGTGQVNLAAAGAPGQVRVSRLTVRTPQIEADASGQLAEGLGALDYRVRLADLGLLVPGFPGAATAEGSVAQMAGGGWRLQLDANGPGGVGVRASGTAAQDFGRLSLNLSGNAPARLANAALAPNAVAGTVRFDLQLEGPPALTSLSGRVTLADGRFDLAQPRTALTDLNARATLSGGRAQLSASAAVEGGGRLTVEGPVTLSRPFGAGLAITAQGVMLSDPTLYETSIDARLRVDGPLTGGAGISGTVTLGPTEIQVPEGALSGAAAIPEIAHVGASADVQRTRSRAGLIEIGGSGRAGGRAVFGLDISVRAPNRIFVRGRGLDAEFGGAIRLSGTTANVIPSGQFSLFRGRFDILGKRLELDEAEISLRGALVPYLRLLARSETEDATIFIGVEGPADAPEFRFYSEPELPEDEVLARLLFGKGIDTLSVFQAAELAAATAQLTGRGRGIGQRLRESLGLDDLDTRQSSGGGAGIGAGRYLSENVYTDLSVGTDSSEVTLNLDITSNLKARGTVDSKGETGLGIFFERDY